MPNNDWIEANRRYLLAALGCVRNTVRRAVGNANAGGGEGAAALPSAEDDERAVLEAAVALPAPSAIETLVAAFGLSPFERDVLLLCAGVELDARFAAECLGGRGDGSPFPTFGQAMAALPEPHWSALAPTAPLRRWRLIELGDGVALSRTPLRIDERIVHYLTGIPCLDPRLHGLLTPVISPGPGPLPPSLAAVAGRAAGLWGGPAAVPPPPVLLLCGEAESGKRPVAAAACASLDLGLYAVRADDLPAAPSDRETIATLCDRESWLEGFALLIECDHDADGPPPRPVIALAERLGAPLLIAGRDPVRLRGRPTVRLDVNRGDAREQRDLWAGAVGPAADRLDGRLDGLAAQFHLDAESIQSVGASVVAEDPSAPADALGARLWDACRARAQPRMDSLAQRIEPVATWHDLVLPEPLLDLLREIAVHVRQRSRVYGTWGFAARGSRGLGISALFAGASGTGKTLAAEVIAHELRLDLYRIDLSQVVSKYIGETEKNLRRVFDAAEEGGAILLFDEADALFGKRTEVKDSHDRHANIEVSYLLQRMECYRGLAILTTNKKNDLDPAFLRRIRFVVQFPFPDAPQRAEIWRRIFPEDTPRDGLDYDRLSRLNVPGGNIRNIALHAAFHAAESGEPVKMEHIRRAAETEFTKLERSWSDDILTAP